MIKYLIKRVISVIPIIIGITIIVFAAIQLAPGDAADILMGSLSSQEDIDAAREQWGLDQPVYIQYANWVKRAVTGDFGTSLSYKQPVLKVISEKIGPTLILAAAALIIAVPLGILFGTASAVYNGRFIDKLLTGCTILTSSIPVFWLGMMLIILFSQILGLLPPSGMHSAGVKTFSDLLAHLMLPALTLSFIPMTVILRITKSSMLEVMSRDYITTAKSKGCSRVRCIRLHVIKNAFVPILTILGVEVGYVIGGALVVENVFSWPGIGSLLLSAVLTRDYPLVVCGALLLCIVYVTINLTVDLLYGYFDPRIQYE